MSNIRHYIATERYWETLEALRDRPDFDVIRRKIDECLLRKSENPTYRNDRDKPFDADPRLKGIWHCKLTTESDAVLFYAIKGSSVVLGFIGSHKDYPFNGANGSKVPALANRMRRAAEARHVESPAWRGLHWKVPEDLVLNRRLFELDMPALRTIMDRLIEERQDAPIYEAVYGQPLLEASEQNFDAWMTSIDRAAAAVRAAARQVEIGLKRAPERAEIVMLRRNVEETAPLSVLEMCAVARRLSCEVSSSGAGRRLSGQIAPLCDVLEFEPDQLDGYRLSYLLGEAVELLLDEGNPVGHELAPLLPELQDALENPDGEVFAAHVATVACRARTAAA